jgi:RND superfamily putative drug exporter
VAVLIDAFVIRALLVPALMALLEDWNWWSPAPLHRLHEWLNVSEGEARAQAPDGRPLSSPVLEATI